MLDYHLAMKCIQYNTTFGNPLAPIACQSKDLDYYWTSYCAGGMLSEVWL